jgi:hypothetical protein
VVFSSQAFGKAEFAFDEPLAALSEQASRKILLGCMEGKLLALLTREC